MANTGVALQMSLHTLPLVTESWFHSTAGDDDPILKSEVNPQNIIQLW